MRYRRQIFVCVALLLLAVMPLLPVAPGAGEQPGDEFAILLTNDDGYRSPGLLAMVEAFAPEFHVVVAAPAEQQSGVSNAITFREPIFVREVELHEGVKAYAVSAYPATCARLGIESLMERKPDLVISGINSSPNLGNLVVVSGTVGAARQAAMTGVAAIAVSRGRGADYDEVAKVALELVRRLREEGRIEPGLFLNVNVPAGELRGTRVVRQSGARDSENYERRVSPRGFVYYWSNWTPAAGPAVGTDIDAFAQGYVTITPLRVDQTDTGAMESLRDLEEAR